MENGSEWKSAKFEKHCQKCDQKEYVKTFPEQNPPEMAMFLSIFSLKLNDYLINNLKIIKTLR